MSQGESERTILVIDDEYAVRRLMKLFLERKGYQVLTAADGARGLILAKVKQPDIILLDLMMPKMDGHEVLQRLKSDPDTKDTHVIVVTAKSGDRDQVAAFRLGVLDYIEKPYRTADLLRKIKIAFPRQEDSVHPPASEDT